MASQTQNPHSTTVQPQTPIGSRNKRIRQTQNSVCARALPHRFTAHATPVQSSWLQSLSARLCCAVRVLSIEPQ